MMSSPKRFRSPAIFIVGAAILILAGLTLDEFYRELGSLLFLIGYGLWVGGTFLLANAKGWHWTLGLLGVTIIGTLVIALLDDRKAPDWAKASGPTRAVILREPRQRLTITRARIIPALALLACAILALYPPWIYTYLGAWNGSGKKAGPKILIVCSAFARESGCLLWRDP